MRNALFAVLLFSINSIADTRITVGRAHIFVDTPLCDLKVTERNQIADRALQMIFEQLQLRNPLPNRKFLSTIVDGELERTRTEIEEVVKNIRPYLSSDKDPTGLRLGDSFPCALFVQFGFPQVLGGFGEKFTSALSSRISGLTGGASAYVGYVLMPLKRTVIDLMDHTIVSQHYSNDGGWVAIGNINVGKEVGNLSNHVSISAGAIWGHLSRPSDFTGMGFSGSLKLNVWRLLNWTGQAGAVVNFKNMKAYPYVLFGKSFEVTTAELIPTSSAPAMPELASPPVAPAPVTATPAGPRAPARAGVHVSTKLIVPLENVLGLFGGLMETGTEKDRKSVQKEEDSLPIITSDVNSPPPKVEKVLKVIEEKKITPDSKSNQVEVESSQVYDEEQTGTALTHRTSPPSDF